MSEPTDDVFLGVDMVSEETDFQNQGAETNDLYAPEVLGAAAAEEGLFIVPSGYAREMTNFAADGKYMHADPSSKEVTVKLAALLSMDMIKKSDDPPFITASSEKNITKSLERDTDRETYTLGLGIGWQSGARCSAIFIPDCIMEYQPKKAPRVTQSVKTGRSPGEYFEDYLRMGIKACFYDWIISSAKEMNLELTKAEKDTRDDDVIVERNGKKVVDKTQMYCWFIANIAKTQYPLIKVNLGTGPKSFKDKGQLRWIMDKICGGKDNAPKGVVCNAVFRCSAKRPPNYDGKLVSRTLGFNLISAEIIDITRRQSKPLDPIRDFEGTGIEASSALTALLSRKDDGSVASVPGSRPPVSKQQAVAASSRMAAAAAPRAGAGPSSTPARSTAAGSSSNL